MSCCDMTASLEELSVVTDIGVHTEAPGAGRVKPPSLEKCYGSRYCPGAMAVGPVWQGYTVLTFCDISGHAYLQMEEAPLIG